MRETKTQSHRGVVARVGLDRRRVLALGGALAAAAALAACGDDAKGSRDDPFPYQDPRSRNTRL